MMSGVRLPSFVFLLTLLLTSCLPSSKFKDDKSAISAGSNPAADIIRVPSNIELPVSDSTAGGSATTTNSTTTPASSTTTPASSTTTNTNITRASTPVNGAWGSAGTPWWANVNNNTQYVTKYCNQPLPLNGGTECIKEASWTHGYKDGVQFAYKATGVCRNSYIWNGNECVEGKNAITSVALNDPNVTYDMKRFWPAPVDGTAYIKEFEYGSNLEIGNITDPNRARMVQRYTRESDGTYTIQDWLVGWPKAGYTLASLWHYKFDNNRGIIEFSDDVTSRVDWTTVDRITFDPGKELLWGNFLKLHEVLFGDVSVHNGSQSAYVWVQIKETFKSYTIAGTTYYNVVKLRNLQGSCAGNDCSLKGPEIIGDYYMAEGIGIIRSDWLENDTARYLGPGGVLTKSCTVSSTVYHCP